MQPALGGCVGGQRIPVAPGGRAVRPGAVGRRATFFCGDAFYTFTVHLACGDFSCCLLRCNASFHYRLLRRTFAFGCSQVSQLLSADTYYTQRIQPNSRYAPDTSPRYAGCEFTPAPLCTQRVASACTANGWPTW